MRRALNVFKKRLNGVIACFNVIVMRLIDGSLVGTCLYCRFSMFPLFKCLTYKEKIKYPFFVDSPKWAFFEK